MDYGVIDSIWFGLICLFGEEDRHWEYYETDPDWWAVRLWISKN